ncbi:MAG: TylF/MycF/NovP-related O-methyltransferase [Candidatus Methylomirabilales bacterium]
MGWTGYAIKRTSTEEPSIYDMDKDFLQIWATSPTSTRPLQKYTQTKIERAFALYKAVEFVTAHRIEGDLVECGVWRGGMVMLMAYALERFGDTSRHLHLFDTFKGMTEPSEIDVRAGSRKAARERWEKRQAATHNKWGYVGIDDVRANMALTRYPANNIHFHEGNVTKTLPCEDVKKISILRLDTDWYESTRHGLVHLYPKLAAGGFCIIDDYAEWEGARKAVDEYIAEHKLKVFLNRVDRSCRQFQKVADL